MDCKEISDVVGYHIWSKVKKRKNIPRFTLTMKYKVLSCFFVVKLIKKIVDSNNILTQMVNKQKMDTLNIKINVVICHNIITVLRSNLQYKLHDPPMKQKWYTYSKSNINTFMNKVQFFYITKLIIFFIINSIILLVHVRSTMPQVVIVPSFK